MKSGIVSLGKETMVYGLGDALYKAVAFLLLPVYLKHLTPAGYGTLESLMVTRGLAVTLIAVGLPNAILRFYYRAKGEQERKSVLSTIFFISLGLQIVIAGLFFLNREWLSTMVLKSPEFGFFLAILAANIFLISFRGIPFAIFRAKKRAIAYSITNLTIGIVTLLMNILFVAYLERGVLGVLYGNLCGGFVGLIIVVPALLKSINLSFNIHFVRRILSFSIPLGLAAVPFTIIFMADRYFIVCFTNLSDLGIYALAYKFASILKTFVIMPFMLAWGPFVFSKEHEINAEETYCKATKYFVMIALSFVVFISVIQIDLISILTKNTEFYGASKIVPVLCYGFFFFGFASIVRGVGIRLSGKTYYTTSIAVAGMALNLALNYVLTRKFSVMGAASSFLITFLVIFIISYLCSQKLYTVNHNMRKLFTLIIISVIAIILSQFATNKDPFHGVTIRALILMAFYFCIFFYGLSQSERNQFYFQVLGLKPSPLGE